MKEINIRRSVRKYLDKTVEKEKIEKLLRAAMQAPSAANQQPWEFVVVQNREKLVELSGMSPYSGLVADAPLAIVLIGNKERMPFGEYWEQDMGAAAENLLLEAVNLGLAGVWLGVHPIEERVQNIVKALDLPENAKPFAMIAAGYPRNADDNHFTDRFDPARVHWEKY